MKYILQLFAMMIVANNAIAQEYKNALQIPNTVKEGYIGKVKTVTKSVYDVRFVGTQPVKTKLKYTTLDSMDIDGYTVKVYEPGGDWEVLYNYNKHREMISNIHYTNGKLERTEKFKLLNPQTVLKETYLADSKNPDKQVDTTTYENNRIIRATGEFISFIIAYPSRDTTILLMNPLDAAITSVVLERDSHENVLKSLNIPEHETDVFTPSMTIYKYEYYQ